MQWTVSKTSYYPILGNAWAIYGTRSCQVKLGHAVHQSRSVEEAAPQHQAIRLIFDDKWLTFEAFLNELSHCICFISKEVKIHTMIILK